MYNQQTQSVWPHQKSLLSRNKNTVLNIAYSELNKLKALGESHKSACLKVKLSSIRPVSLKIAF